MTMDNPIQNSEVYLCHPPHSPPMPPPSPPSSATPDEGLPYIEGLGSIAPLKTPICRALFTNRLDAAHHVLRTEASALEALTKFYASDAVAQEGFYYAIEEMTKCKRRRGKVMVTGIGKSGHIGKKLEATLNSLGITAVFIHPSEAVHGDLGVVCPEDIILFISNSGKTAELIQTLPHFSPSLPALIITEATSPEACEIIKQRPGTILLPAPLPLSEEAAFGVKAPTISTTMALALGDALALAASRELYSNSLSNVFHKNHPGGAIGAAIKNIQKIQKVSDRAVPLIDIPDVSRTSTISQVGFAAFQSESGWIRMGSDVVVPPRCIKNVRTSNTEIAATSIPGLTASRRDWIQVPSDRDVSEMQDWIRSMRKSPGGDATYHDGVVLVTMEEDEMCGVMEIGDLMG
ncbi:hypothetical protein HYFRA_00004315 [Hymenoscyphus fraxineus]|uniref:SIS domain-containing protein n=1 Tax=Hymenoscyphus fraxineus TaxID=746836 RepID=A0A9N9KN24_9HELO|nr:hypothetical protein HYFRA_00004315 [Hymenoscyphus fraxineus]